MQNLAASCPDASDRRVDGVDYEIEKPPGLLHMGRLRHHAADGRAPGCEELVGADGGLDHIGFLPAEQT